MSDILDFGIAAYFRFDSPLKFTLQLLFFQLQHILNLIEVQDAGLKLAHLTKTVIKKVPKLFNLLRLDTLYRGMRVSNIMERLVVARAIDTLLILKIEKSRRDITSFMML